MQAHQAVWPMANIAKALSIPSILLKDKVWVYLLFTFVILNVKPLHGFLVGFMCPCFYFQFIMNSVFGKCLLYFVHFLFFAITTIIVMLF